MTVKQIEKFNKMFYALKKISSYYQTTKQLRRNSESEYGLDYEEALEMAYENIQGEAKFALKRIKPITP